MCEACTELDARLEAVANVAAPLPSRLPRVRDPMLGRWMAHQLDALLRNITAGHGALDVAIGEGLDALDVGRRAMDLKYSNIGDYAREELGINASTATKTARLARRLRERPLVREAVRRGELTARKAEIIAPVAVGDQQARWILRAKAETVRSLKVAVEAPADPDDEEWVNLCADVSPEKLPALDEGSRLAGVIIGATATKMQRLNAWAEEFQSSHPAPADEHADDVLFTPEDDLESLKKLLEASERCGGRQGRISRCSSGGEALVVGGTVPRSAGGSLHRDLEAAAQAGEHAAAPRPRPRQAPLPGPGLQQGGSARPPHHSRVAGRNRRPRKPDQPLRRPPPVRHPRRPHARHRHGAGRARLGIRPAAQWCGCRVKQLFAAGTSSVPERRRPRSEER